MSASGRTRRATADRDDRRPRPGSPRRLQRGVRRGRPALVRDPDDEPRRRRVQRQLECLCGDRFVRRVARRADVRLPDRIAQDLGDAQRGVLRRAAAGHDHLVPSKTNREPGTRQHRIAVVGRTTGDSGRVAGGRRYRSRCRGCRPDRTDARARPSRRERRGAAAGDPVERPADRGRVRPDPRSGWCRAADRDHRQRRADRLHGAEARVGARPRTGTWARIAHVLLPKDYLRLRLTGEHAMDKADGAGTLLFDLAARNWSPEVVAALRIDPAWLPPTYEGPEMTGVVYRGGSRGDGPRRGHAGRRRRWRPVGERRRRRRRQPRAMALSLGTSGVVFARDRRAAVRATRPRPCLLPRRARAVAHDVGDALRGREPALVPRRACAGRGIRCAGRATRPTSRPAATASCSSPTSRASAAPSRSAGARRLHRPDA